MRPCRSLRISRSSTSGNIPYTGVGFAYVVAEIVWPLVFAFILSLLLKPLLRLLERLHIPRVLCAFLLVAAVFRLFVGLGTAISGPAASWRQNCPMACRGFSSGSAFSKLLRHTPAFLAEDREFRRMAAKVQAHR